MSKSFTVLLNEPQINQLLTVLRDAHEEGSYYGNREMYWARHYRIVSLLENALRDETTSTSDG